MSKQPLSLPTSLHIFKNLVSHGYWQSRWYSTHTREEREAMMKKLVELMESGKVRKITTIRAHFPIDALVLFCFSS